MLRTRARSVALGTKLRRRLDQDLVVTVVMQGIVLIPAIFGMEILCFCACSFPYPHTDHFRWHDVTTRLGRRHLLRKRAESNDSTSVWFYKCYVLILLIILKV
jgi:hypothetical protein